MKRDARKLEPTVFIDAVPELSGRTASGSTGREGTLAQRRTEAAGSSRKRGMRTHRRDERVKRLAIVFLVIGLSASAACSSKVLMPPRVDLTAQHRVGLVSFTIENAQGSLNELATERFMTHVLGGQPGIEVLELGDAETLLAEIGESQLGPRAAQRIGDAYGTNAVFFGHLIVSDVKPRGVLAGLNFPHVEANVTVEIRARLLSTESGGTIWSNSARATETVGQVGLAGGVPYFSAEDPNDAYGRLVDHLVYAVTADFRPYWVRQ